MITSSIEAFFYILCATMLIDHILGLSIHYFDRIWSETIAKDLPFFKTYKWKWTNLHFLQIIVFIILALLIILSTKISPISLIYLIFLDILLIIPRGYSNLSFISSILAITFLPTAISSLAL